MSSFLTTALFGSAIIVGSVSGAALARDSTNKVKPCIGDLCPPKSPGLDMPYQKLDGADAEAVHGQDQSSDQVMPLKKKQASFHRNRHQQSSGQVMPRKKKQASNRQQQPSKKAASRSNFWNWLF